VRLRFDDPDEGSLVPPRFRSRLGLTFCFDTNLVADESPAMEELRRANEDGWINLTRTDTLDTELAEHRNPDSRADFLERSSDYVEHHGAVAWEHSRWDHAVWASEEDEERLDKVIRTLFPNADPRERSTDRAKAQFRDAKHVDTAVRYGATGLITNDRRDLLDNADAIKRVFDGFLILTPEEAVVIVRRFRARHDERDRPSEQ
jgi:hypothetical protein